MIGDTRGLEALRGNLTLLLDRPASPPLAPKCRHNLIHRPRRSLAVTAATRRIRCSIASDRFHWPLWHRSVVRHTLWKNDPWLRASGSSAIGLSQDVSSR